MSGRQYTPAEIEQKRLLALQRKAERKKEANNVTKTNNSSDTTNYNYTANVKPQDSLQRQHNKSNTSNVARTLKSNNRYSPMKPHNFFNSPSKVIKGCCTMINELRFTVDVSYNPKLIQVFRTMSSNIFDQKTKNWNFDLSDYDRLMAECVHLKPEIVIEEIPRYVLRVFRDNHRKKTSTEFKDLSSIDEKLTESLMPFQREGISFGISKQGRCIIADDMGLGKTIQALGIAHYYRENWPLLIVTPSSVRYQWSEAIFNFLPSVPTLHVHQFTSGKDYVGSSKITIVSYDLLVRCAEMFYRQSYGFVILDESHCLKSGKTARTKVVDRITSEARHVVLLSGTPALSRPIELYSQISLVVPSFMGFHEYGLRYCAAEKSAFGWIYRGSSNMHELQLLLRACCLIRRLKSDVLKELPSKIREVVILDPNLIAKASKEAQKIANKLNNTNLNGSERHAAILEYYHESSQLRINAVCNYVSDLLENGEKFLIYAHHQNVLEAICQQVESARVKYIKIDGKTRPEQRKYFVDLFQESDSHLVAVLSINAANAGITLTAARLVVFAELFWNPGILCQAEDRVHRIGQDSNVVIRYLVAKNTADDHLWPLIQRKINVLTKAGLDQDFCLNKADVSEQKVNEDASVSSSSNMRQTTLDSHFIGTRFNESSDESKITSERKDEEKDVVKLQQQEETSTSFEHLLDLDDADFDAIDLENIT